MGEIADYVLDMAFDEGEEIQEGLETFTIAGGAWAYGQQYFECKYCGKSGLKWGEVHGSWRLHEDAKIHECEEYHKKNA